MAKRTLLIGCTSDAVLSTGRTPGGRVISCCRLLWCESTVALPFMPVMPTHWSHGIPPLAPPQLADTSRDRRCILNLVHLQHRQGNRHYPTHVHTRMNTAPLGYPTVGRLPWACQPASCVRCAYGCSPSWLVGPGHPSTIPEKTTGEAVGPLHFVMR